VVETLLPMTAESLGGPTAQSAGASVEYEFLPDARSILEELVPVSFKIRLFKCFLDAAVSEQISRMVAMRGATENADEMIKTLTRSYNRARQTQITRELSEIIGAAAALQ
jgi:F-type H+-transporting ATPase subunit gamma